MLSFLGKIGYGKRFRDIRPRDLENSARRVAFFNVSRNYGKKRRNKRSSHNFVIIAYRVFDNDNVAFLVAVVQAERGYVFLRIERVSHNFVITLLDKHFFHFKLVFLLFRVTARGNFTIF